jgi:hypothetical protein
MSSLREFTVSGADASVDEVSTVQQHQVSRDF